MRPERERSENRVSVIVPLFNGSRTIEKTLKSILGQEHEIEIIIVDDASSDKGAAQAASLLQNESERRYRVIHHEKNRGLSASLNEGLSCASGKYILVLHQDCELLRPDWISLAVKTMEDRVAVVTGYYGIPDDADMNLAMTTFGLLRRQIHSRPSTQIETVNFSEGKCDLYDKGVLEKVGGFPIRYRIAGEDLSISINLRKQGYSIVKNYELPVVQRFGGKADSISGNIRKEFEFGKAMGGVVEEHRLSTFSDAGRGYSRARTSHRMGQLTFTGAIAISFLLYLIFPSMILVYSVFGILLLRYAYYVFLLAKGLRTMQRRSRRWLVNALRTAPLGIVSDTAYSLGFVWGLLRGLVGTKL